MPEMIPLVEKFARDLLEAGAARGTLGFASAPILHWLGLSGLVDLNGTTHLSAAYGAGFASEPYHALTEAVRTTLGAPADAPIQMRLRVSGDHYEFQYRRTTELIRDLDWAFARRLVLDRQYRYPGQTSPIQEPGPTVPDPHKDLTVGDVDTLSGDLALWNAQLTSPSPVHIAPLAALRSLQRLDISTADVADLQELTQLNRLRVLVASPAQWRALISLNAVPTNLAVAELAGDVSFDDEIAWATAFGVHPELALVPVIQGRLTAVPNPSVLIAPKALLRQWMYEGSVLAELFPQSTGSAETTVQESDSVLREQVEEIVRTLTGAGGPVWTSTLTHSLSGWSVSGFSGHFGHTELELVSAVRAALGVSPDHAVWVRLRLMDNGYEFQYHSSTDPSELDSKWDFARQLVFDPNYRYPRHDIQSTPTPSAPENRPTDPAVLATVGDLVHQYRDQCTNIESQMPELGTGLSETEISSAETLLGFRLPEELRALYRFVGHDHNDRGILGDCTLRPLEDVTTGHLHDQAQRLAERSSLPGRRTVPGAGIDSLFAHERVVLESWPYGTVQRNSRNPNWLIIGDSDGNDYAVDLDPGPAGRLGQLICLRREELYSPEPWAESVIDGLRRALDRSRGLDHGTVVDTPASSQSLGGPTADLADLPDQFAIQKLLIDREHFDATELTPLIVLRQLILHVETAELAVPHSVPVESLTINAQRIDLGPLSEHPTLWDIELHCPNAPVHIGSLATLKSLQRLDISDADIADLASLANLTSVRVLVANWEQWHYLHEHGAVPPRLAAAELGDRPTFSAEVAWAHGFGVDAPTADMPIIRGALQSGPPHPPV